MKLIVTFIAGFLVGVLAIYFFYSGSVNDFHSLYNEKYTFQTIDGYEFLKEADIQLKAGKIESVLNSINKAKAIHEDILQKCLSVDCAPGLTSDIERVLKP